MKTAAPIRIAICMPSADEMKADTMLAVARIHSFLTSKGIPFTFLNGRDSIVARARNDIVGRALKIGAEYLWWLDSDMWCEADTALKLMRHGKSIAGCLYSQKIEPYGTVGQLLKPGATSGLHEALKLGGGCLLIKASVYKQMPFPWYHEIFKWDGDAVQSFRNMLRDTSIVRPSPEVLEKMIQAPGVREWLEANHVAMKEDMIGEDYTFCGKVIERLGCKIWADVSLSRTIGHIGPKTFELPQLQTATAAAQ